MFGEIGALTRQKCSVFLLQEYSIVFYPIQEKSKDQMGQLGNANNIIGMMWDIIDRPKSVVVSCRLFLTVFSREMWQK